MASETQDAESVPPEQASDSALTTDITLRLVGLSMVCGLIGMVVMLPLLAGVPVALGIFQAEPLIEFANIATFFGITPDLIGSVLGYDPRLVLGGLIFVFGGILFLPVQFLVVASFLPPETPRFVRGGTFAILWWFGFVFAFWPSGAVITIAAFVLLSFAAHLLYGLTMGYLITRWAAIPQHAV
jgi:hypothetical protein